MINLAIFVFTVCTTSAGILGHPPVLADWICRTAAWTLRSLSRTSHTARAPERPSAARTRPVPSWAHTEPYQYDEAA
ncbi:hypothetical protein ACFCYB_00310 [Streptomyces sp. NPDC056309]|uniref:hypothetical protein n=1 Tax=Streptomyces sp. NPDC056309 TaxID=3345781 RepID=UPI0035DE16F7